MRGTQNKLSQGSIAAGLALRPGRATPRELGGCVPDPQPSLPRGTEPPNEGGGRGPRGHLQGPEASGAIVIGRFPTLPLSLVVGGREGSGGERDDTLLLPFQPPKPGRDAPVQVGDQGGGGQYQSRPSHISQRY
jgi:hypothetical protein